MHTPLDILHTDSYPKQTDIFVKYLLGVGVTFMPFALLPQWKKPIQAQAQFKTANIRGPYRRYTHMEKEITIQRMLSGEGLKKIADETAIPKRNLIRWKHEFLHKKTKVRRQTSQECQESMELEFKQIKIRKSSMETKETLSEDLSKAGLMIQYSV